MAVEIAQFTCHGWQKFFKVQVKQGSDGWDPVKRGKGKSKLTTKTWGYQERKVKERSCAACVWTRCSRQFEMEENGEWAAEEEKEEEEEEEKLLEGEMRVRDWAGW
jgi:hypothetical protein